jgi:hypothetical protein
MDDAAARVGSSGPAVHVTEYARELIRRGYAERTVKDHLRLTAEMDRWMVDHKLALTEFCS